MIILTPTRAQLRDMLVNDLCANWSYDGALVIVDHLEDLYADDTYDFDLADIRGRYSEYKDWYSLAKDFQHLDKEEIENFVLYADDNCIIIFNE